jgi:hypothetical protein
MWLPYPRGVRGHWACWPDAHVDPSMVVVQGAHSDPPLNARIVACGAEGDSDGLPGLGRRVAKAGEGPEALSFNHVNCAT